MIRLLGSLAAMYGTHWKLALVATAIAPISWHLIRVTGRTVGYYSTVQNEAMAKASALAVEVLGAVRTVHANAGEPKEAVSFRGTMNGYLRVIKFTVYAETVLRFTDKGLAQVRDYVVLALGMYQVVNGQMTIGAYTAFASYVSIYEVGFSAFADLWITLKQTIASTGRFLQVNPNPYSDDSFQAPPPIPFWALNLC
jgi:subfamily B ATP-binding cassette protein MsbA